MCRIASLVINKEDLSTINRMLQCFVPIARGKIDVQRRL
jgi:hypothetical protein